MEICPRGINIPAIFGLYNVYKASEQASKKFMFAYKYKALDESTRVDKFIDCKLCTKNCPNKILVKANEEIPAVHVDYEKGKKLYKFDCAKYGEICPTGAIIKQDGKSPILNTQKCIGCGACKSMCWHGIIEIFSVKEQKTI